ALAVAYTVAGSAAPGTEYAALSGTVALAAGQTSATVNVLPVDDPHIEPDETVLLTLSAGSNYQIGDPASATVTIADNDTITAGAVVRHQQRRRQRSRDARTGGQRPRPHRPAHLGGDGHARRSGAQRQRRRLRLQPDGQRVRRRLAVQHRTAVPDPGGQLRP